MIKPTFGNTVTLRINITETEFGFYTDTILATVSIPKDQDRILAGDIVILYGVCEGLYSYTATFGQKISLSTTKFIRNHLIHAKTGIFIFPASCLTILPLRRYAEF